jgi:hypothetical protein
LRDNFIETPEYRSLLETSDSTVVIGRRGTGKSAMFMKLTEFWGSQKACHVINIAPEDYQTLLFRALFKVFDGKYPHVRAAARVVMKYGILMEMLTHLSKNYKAKQLLESDPKAMEHIKFWMRDQSDFFSKITTRISPVLREADDLDSVIGKIHSKMDINYLEDSFIKAFGSSSIRFYILLDRLDEGYENDEMGAAIIAGVIACISEVNKKYEYVRTVLFQRDNIIRSVAKFDPDYTRNIEGEIIRIHWDTYQLMNLATKRLNAAFSLSMENTQKIWDRCTANEGGDRELQGMEGFKKCLQFTLYRPRDLLSLLNQSFYMAGREERSTIVLSDVEKTAKNISETRLEDLKKEYKSIIPAISIAVPVFANGSPELSYSAALELLDQLSSNTTEDIADGPSRQDVAILQSDGILRALYSVGFIGTHDELTNTFAFCHDGRNPDREFSNNDRLLVHPCYWIALNLSRDALAPEEAEEINDEYEIKVKSVSTEIRAQKIGKLIADIGVIPEGREGAEDFESWVFSAVQTVFASHLSRVELKPNGDAVQRRDIVGTNLGLPQSWQRIREDYDVRQVVFDAKNYKTLGRDEYRQMSTYLNGQYGRLGFLVSRDDDDALRAGAELDWVREIFHSERKLVIRLSYKFFQRLLSKLRSPEKHDSVDNALHGLLDTYERRYLSLQTTRAKRPSKR